MEPLRAYRTEDVLINYVKWLGAHEDQALDLRTSAVPEQDVGKTILDCEGLPPHGSEPTESIERESDTSSALEDKLEDQTADLGRLETSSEENDASSVHSEEVESFQSSAKAKYSDIENSSEVSDIADNEKISEIFVPQSLKAGTPRFDEHFDWHVAPELLVVSDNRFNAKLLG
ncbi:hypothetical protein MMC17_008426, partial [Xylographa soralifera]|nr:hypothetical protein [Xylographa soralifera]